MKMGNMPRWTVNYNIVSPESDKWIGTGWEFFDEEHDAASCYRRHRMLGNVPTMRPFHHSDVYSMGIVHQHVLKDEAGRNPTPRELATELVKDYKGGHLQDGDLFLIMEIEQTIEKALAFQKGKK